MTVGCKEVATDSDDEESERQGPEARSDDNYTEKNQGEQRGSVDGHAIYGPSQCTKSGEMIEGSGMHSRWRGSRSKDVADDARLQSQRNFIVQLGEHPRGHPRFNFGSSHPPYGFQQSSLSAAGSVGECLNENYNDHRRPAIMPGHEGGPPGEHDRMYRHADACHSMGRHERARWRGHVGLKVS